MNVVVLSARIAASLLSFNFIESLSNCSRSGLLGEFLQRFSTRPTQCSNSSKLNDALEEKLKESSEFHKNSPGYLRNVKNALPVEKIMNNLQSPPVFASLITASCPGPTHNLTWGNIKKHTTNLHERDVPFLDRPALQFSSLRGSAC